MKKIDTTIRDIYRAKDSETEEIVLSENMSDMIEREIHQRWIFNLFVGLFAMVLIAALTAALVIDLSSAQEKAPPIEKKSFSVASYTLPMDEQWALEYRQVAYQADSSEPPGPKALSSKWVKNTAYHIIMGEQALRMNDPVVAQNHLEAAADVFPAMAGVHHYLGTVYLKRQYFEKAVEQLRKALKDQPAIDVLNNLGVAYMGIKEYGRAEELLQQALQQQPDLAGCYKNLALLYQETGQTNKAVACFEEYFMLNPQDTPLLENYVAYLASAGRLDAAMVFLARVDGADSLTVYLLLARTAAQNNDAERAVRALQEVAQILTPRQTMEQMHHAAFEKIAKTEPFEALLYKLELATVAPPTNLNKTGENKH